MRSRNTSGDAALTRAPALSFAEVYDQHVDEVYRYIHRRCQDHSLAEDVTQDTFMKAIGSTDNPGTITIGWLITIARNRLLDLFRRQATYEGKLRLVANSDPGSDEIDVAERLRVESALRMLPIHYRLVLSLHYLNGMTVRSIAEELDQSFKSIEGLITRARRELRAVLEADEPHQPDQGGAS